MKVFMTVAFLILSSTILASTITTSGKVEFIAKGFPTFITINGKGDGVKGDLEITGNQVKKATFTFPLKSLKTGMDLRDEHMHEKYLESGKFPEAKLVLSEFPLNESGEVTGKLKLHNVEKQIKVQYQREGQEPLRLNAEFKVLLEDFGIEIPSFQGITVAKDILIKVNLN